MVMILALALQATPAPDAPTPEPAPAPERFSILTDASPPCLDARDDKGDIVVCSRGNQAQRLPLPDDRGPPDGPTPSNPYKTGSGALAASVTPCPISRDCVVGFGPPIVPLIKGAVGLVKGAFAKKPDKTGRVAIPLDDNDAPTGRLEP